MFCKQKKTVAAVTRLMTHKEDEIGKLPSENKLPMIKEDFQQPQKRLLVQEKQCKKDLDQPRFCLMCLPTVSNFLQLKSQFDETKSKAEHLEFNFNTNIEKLQPAIFNLSKIDSAEKYFGRGFYCQLIEITSK
uniref:Uncharacterized protein n=1 Tax=Romanomermis culicivorax TaxID=13658 RepID=A0A915KH48_ROMCU